MKEGTLHIITVVVSVFAGLATVCSFVMSNWSEYSIVILLVFIVSVVVLGFSYFRNDLSFNKNVVLLCVIVLVIFASVGLGFYFDGFNNSLNQSDSSGDAVSNVDAGYRIVVDYDGPYTSGYGTEFDKYDFTSEGYNDFDVGNTSFINVGAKKSDGSNKKLTLKIMKGNSVVEEKTTTKPYGEVTIHFKE